MSRKRTKASRKKQKDKKRRQKKGKAAGDDDLTLSRDLPRIPDRRAMEGTMFNMFGGTRGGPDDQAQDLMYQAWDAASPRERIDLARAALEISPDCVDAYVLLAEETASTDEEAAELFRLGVEAGERRLGEQAFEEDVGHFWGLLETRPYMRARAGLAGSLWRAGQREAAVEHFLEMLRLNPNDNQGIRHTLMACLMLLRRDDDARALLRQYAEDGSAVWLYSAALLCYREESDTERAGRLLAEAREGNPHVPAYLSGKKRLPRRLPDYIGFGDESEAAAYASEYKEIWASTPGALPWLSGQCRCNMPKTP